LLVERGESEGRMAADGAKRSVVETQGSRNNRAFRFCYLEVQILPPRPGSAAFGQASEHTREWGGKTRLFAHRLLPTPNLGEVEGEIDESLRPNPQIFQFCGDYRRRRVRSPLPPDHGSRSLRGPCEWIMGTHELPRGFLAVARRRCQSSLSSPPRFCWVFSNEMG
jgi:hypothetical protein